jgi:hypothetical protein
MELRSSKVLKGQMDFGFSSATIDTFWRTYQLDSLQSFFDIIMIPYKKKLYQVTCKLK